MILESNTIAEIADAVAERLRPGLSPAGWPDRRITLREPEVASLLGVGHEKIIAARKSGLISHRRAGVTILYTAGDVTGYLERCRANGEGNGR